MHQVYVMSSNAYTKIKHTFQKTFQEVHGDLLPHLTIIRLGFLRVFFSGGREDLI